jgi:osmoprotectant transport system permease protein
LGEAHLMDLLVEVANWLGDAERWTPTARSGVPYRLLEHVVISVAATLVAIAVALPPALWLAHRRRFEVAASAVVNIGRAIPSFGLIVVFWLGATRVSGIATDPWPLIGALVALALPPIFTNTYTAVREVDPAVVEAARGMGLAERDVLRQVELPLASPVVLAGIRLAFVQIIATTAIGAIVTNGGGLGRFIVDGFAIGRAGWPAVIAGALLLGALTLVAEGTMHLVERRLVPAGVRIGGGLARIADRTGAAG